MVLRIKSTKKRTSTTFENLSVGSWEEHSHPIKSLALLFLHEEEAYGSEEGYVEQVSVLLSMNSDNTLQKPL